VSQPFVDVCTPWVTAEDLADCVGATPNEALLDQALMGASNLLFKLSGRKYPGACSDILRPTARYGSWRGVLVDTAPTDAIAGKLLYSGRSWDGFCGCNRTTRAGCHSIAEITLGVYPLVDVTSVKIDGVVLDAADYRVDDYRWLVRIDGGGWPCCQRMERASSEEDTFEVTAIYGVEPPEDGRIAATKLACELYKSVVDPAECKLPKRVTSITRQGVTMALLDPFTILDEGKTGLYEADLFIKTENPAGLQRRATVSIPGRGRRVRRVDT
jgi:hypothetical protein